MHFATSLRTRRSSSCIVSECCLASALVLVNERRGSHAFLELDSDTDLFLTPDPSRQLSVPRLALVERAMHERVADGMCSDHARMPSRSTLHRLHWLGSCFNIVMIGSISVPSAWYIHAALLVLLSKVARHMKVGGCRCMTHIRLTIKRHGHKGGAFGPNIFIRA